MGRSSGFRIKLPAAPSRDVEPTTFVGVYLAVVKLRLSSPVTAAGPQRIRTVFPILPPELRVPSDTHVARHPSIRAHNVNVPRIQPCERRAADGR
jgi:hypothetical protein